MNQEDKNILIKYLDGTASIEEQVRIEKALSSKTKDRNIEGDAKKDWYKFLDSDEVVEKDMGSILDKIHHKLHLKEINLKQSRSYKIYRWSLSAAAIIAIPLLITLLITFSEMSSVKRILAENDTEVVINSPTGSKMAFRLPDGTEGVLNSASSLEYYIPFIANRNVILKGEAYFDVERNEEYPFSVHANSLEVKVLGTRFNVDAYPGASSTEVILEEGLIDCFVGTSRRQVSMVPDERMTISKGKIDKTSVNAEKFIAWKDGKLIFRGDLMSEVASRIERWYNVEVEISDLELSSYSFRGTFENDSLEEVLRLLKMTSPIDYEIVNRVKLPDGSFSKKKIVLFKKQ
jgi:transmembrane sensor